MLANPCGSRLAGGLDTTPTCSLKELRSAAPGGTGNRHAQRGQSILSETQGAENQRRGQYDAMNNREESTKFDTGTRHKDHDKCQWGIGTTATTATRRARSWGSQQRSSLTSKEIPNGGGCMTTSCLTSSTRKRKPKPILSLSFCRAGFAT